MKNWGVIVAVSALLTLVASSAPADEKAADIAGATGCGILATLLINPQLSVAAGGACVYGTEVAKDAVGSLIDKYFDNKDQSFANKYCLTIVRADGSKIEPKNKTNCSK